MRYKHQNINSNLFHKETPRGLRSPVLRLSVLHFFLDTLFLKEIRGLSLNIISNSSVQALCSKVSHLCDPIKIVVTIYDEFPGVKKC